MGEPVAQTTEEPETVTLEACDGEKGEENGAGDGKSDRRGDGERREAGRIGEVGHGFFSPSECASPCPVFAALLGMRDEMMRRVAAGQRHIP